MNTTIDFFNPFPTITTERLVLRKITLEDVSEIFDLRSDTTVLKYIDKIPAKTQQEAIEFIDRADVLLKENMAINWAIVHKGQTRLCGMICIWKIDNLITQGEVGYSMLPLFYGKGIMHEAMTAVIHYAFETMKLKHLEAYTNKNNSASRKLLERNHFKRDLKLELEKCGKTEPDYTVIYTLANR